MKPNVILFMVDQLSAKWLESARDRKICELPNLDWLQQNGSTFTRAITSNPVCSPARATIATGLTSRALDYIREADADQPLFAHVSYVAPHPPFCPPSEVMDKVNPENIPSPVPAEWLHSDEAPEYYRKIARVLNNETDERPIWMDPVIGKGKAGGPADPNVSFAGNRHRYFADIVHLDQQLGRVRDILEETGRLESTTIIFTADHG